MRDVVIVDVVDAVATVTIDQPPLNILCKAAKAQLTAAFETLARAGDVRAVVLRGAGSRAFSAGADINEFPERIRDGNAYEVSRAGHRMLTAIRTCAKPVIAAIDGYAFGAGLEVALCADLRIASDRAQFAFPEITRGVFPGNGGSQLLPRLVGQAHAKQLMLFGARIDSDEAYRIGLLNRVVPYQELMAQATVWASELASGPSVAMGLVKRLVDEASGLPLADGLELEARLFAEVFETTDVREGVAAFRDKRRPNFRRHEDGRTTSR
jgi:enoyl-CoA hydratase